MALPSRRTEANALPTTSDDGAMAASGPVSGTSFYNDLLRRIATNVIHLMSGTAVRVALGMATLAIMARALGPAPLGILVMVEAYGRLIDQLIRLETWQALIRYGAEALEKDEPGDFRRLLKFGVLLDLGGASVAAFGAFLAVPLVGHWMGWSGETMDMARLYSLSLLFGLASTPVAVLRLFDRFALVAWLEPAVAVLQLALSAAAYAAGAGLWTFLLVAMSAQILYRLALCVVAWKELRRRGHHGFLRYRTRGIAGRCRGIWSLIWSANATVLIRKSTHEFDLLIVGGLLGPAAAGIYHIAKRVGNVASKCGALLQQAAFPDLARLWVRRDIEQFCMVVRQVTLATATLALCALLLVALVADRLVVLIAGAEFAASAMPLVIQMAAVALFLCGSTFRPALMSMGLQVELLKVVGLAATAFYLCILLTVPALGVIGASTAHLVFNAIWLPSIFGLFVVGLRRNAATRADGQ